MWREDYNHHLISPFYVEDICLHEGRESHIVSITELECSRSSPNLPNLFSLISLQFTYSEVLTFDFVTYAEE